MSPGVGRLRRALDHQYAAAVTITFGALAALAWSALSPRGYGRVVNQSWLADQGASLREIVLNGAMTFFFAAIGLELSREMRAKGRRPKSASLAPLLGAVGGMAGTALLSLLSGKILASPALIRGWGVPMATDVAFTLGALALAGNRIPVELRVFLLTLAVADDVLSVIVLAVTGASLVRPLGLAALAAIVALAALWGRHAPPLVAFAVAAVPLWLSFAWAGVNPALSGVIAGLITPVHSPTSRRLETNVTRLSVGVVLPLFALVACGVTWTSLSLTGATGRVIFATVVVRLLGKLLGISAGVYVAGRCGARRSPNLTVAILAGASLLCAIGFTVPLLFAGAVFGAGSATYGAFAVGLLGASLVGAALGLTILRRATRQSGEIDRPS